MANERPIGIFPDEAAYAQGLASVMDLRFTYRRIGSLIHTKQSHGYLTRDQEKEKRGLEKKKSQLIRGLWYQSLALDNPLGLALDLKTYPGEEIHATSLTKYRLIAPEPEDPEKEFYIDGTLYELRGDMITSSNIARDVAKEALGPLYTETNRETVEEYVKRAYDEIFVAHEDISPVDPDQAQTIMEKLFLSRIIHLGRNKVLLPAYSYILTPPDEDMESLSVNIGRGGSYISFRITPTRDLFDIHPPHTWKNDKTPNSTKGF